jgi:Helix-turn-helix domain
MDYSVSIKDGGPIIIELKVTSPLTIEIFSACFQGLNKTIETMLQKWLKNTADEKVDENQLPPKNSYILEDEAARITGFSVQTLRNNRFKGLGFPYYKIGRSVRYKVKDILDYMEKYKIQTML